MHHHHCVRIFPLFLNLLSLCLSTSTIYTVTPDDSNTTCHHCHNLQHYLLNITKYFTSNTQLLFLPGLHHLHTDLIIQNVHNISLIGSTANGTTLDTVIIQCNSSVGITMNNITDLALENLAIENCRVTNNFLKIYYMIFRDNAVILSHCNNVHLQNIKICIPQSYRPSILAINVLGTSSFINVTSNRLTIEYSEVNIGDKCIKLLMENYHIPSNILNNAIIIHLYQHSYKVELEFYNTEFTALISANRVFKFLQTGKVFGNLIHFNQCIVEKFNPELPQNLFYFESQTKESKYQMQISFTNCIFRYNKLYRLFSFHGTLSLKLTNCIFKYNQFEVIRMTDSPYSHRNSIIIANTSFYAIKSKFSLIHISSTLLDLEGPVVFIKVEAERILHVQDSFIVCHHYIEFSWNMVSFADHTDYIIVQENTLINMTGNKYSMIQMNPQYYEAYLISNFTAPCYYQYTVRDFDKLKLTDRMNFSIVFHKDIFIHTLMTAHCRWLPTSAFNSTKPMDINNKLITSDFPLAYQKLICSCVCNTTLNCNTNTLATVYPGQTISLSLSFNFAYINPAIETTNSVIIAVEINDDVLPPTACKLAEVSELIHKIYYSSCTIMNFTVVYNGPSYLQWCELFIKIISTHQIDAYYIDILPCPAGFVQHNGICMCDPILKSTLPVTTCDINHQTILRPASSWLSAVTINDSYQYHICHHCPLLYCLPQSSQLNFSTPNSQCQFNRSGLLCGHCQQGLSTVFGYYHCQHCSNVYLLLIIPIAVAGLVLVLLLFILNLTITDGDINGFILYVNIISINNHVFFPQFHKFINFWYAFISLANLDLGIPTCFYNGMDDYAKMWLQLAFPAYLILIATFLIIASRHSTKVQRITERRALPVLATLFLLSYTKILRTVSRVLFYYSTITHLPSGHTTLVWAVDANIPLFGLKYTVLFIVCLILFLILLPFNAILTFTKTLSNFAFINHFKPLIDAYQGPYKYKYYYWIGLQLIMRAVFFGLSALDKNVNLTVSIILLAVISITHAKINPVKHNYKNLYELCYLFYLSTMYTLSYGHYNIAINVIIIIAALQFLLIIIHHTISNICGGVILYKLKNITEMTVKRIARSQNTTLHHVELRNTPPDKAHNYQELIEPLVGLD